MSFKHLIFTGSFIFWSVMCAFLFRKEILPYFAYEAPPSYRDVFKDAESTELTVVDYFINDKPVGTNTLMVRPFHKGYYRMESISELVPRQAGFDLADIKIRTETWVNASFQMDQCIMNISMDALRAKINAIRNQDKMRIIAETNIPGLRTFIDEMEFPKDMYLTDPYNPFLGSTNLYVGKKWKIQSMGFGTDGLKPRILYAVVDYREKHRWKPELDPVDVFKIEIKENPTDEKPQHTLWVDDEGRILEQVFRIGSQRCRVVLREKRKLTPAEARKLGAARWAPVEEAAHDRVETDHKELRK